MFTPKYFTKKYWVGKFFPPVAAGGVDEFATIILASYGADAFVDQGTQDIVLVTTGSDALAEQQSQDIILVQSGVEAIADAGTSTLSIAMEPGGETLAEYGRIVLIGSGQSEVTGIPVPPPVIILPAPSDVGAGGGGYAGPIKPFHKQPILVDVEAEGTGIFSLQAFGTATVIGWKSISIAAEGEGHISLQGQGEEGVAGYRKTIFTQYPPITFTRPTPSPVAAKSTAMIPLHAYGVSQVVGRSKRQIQEDELLLLGGF